MARQNIYTVMSGDDKSWYVIKMDRDYEPEHTYHVSKDSSRLCDGVWCVSRSECRHRTLVEVFLKASAIDSRQAYDFDKNRWITPPKAAAELMK